MTKNGKAIRIIVNSVLLVAIIALGITVFQAGIKSKQEKIQEELTVEKNREIQEETPSVDVDTDEVEADLAETSQEDEEENKTEELQEEETSAEVTEEVVIETAFTEETLMSWPLEGQIVLDYSMDQTIYFPTLNVYKYNPAIAIQSEVGSPVLAAANGTISSIEEMSETGTTIVMDLGNGYQATYGQLSDVTASVGDTVSQGSVIGYVASPTKYYVEEGSNLYFAMKKDGEPLDPIQYLP